MGAYPYWDKILEFFGLKDEEETEYLDEIPKDDNYSIKGKQESKIVSIRRNQELKLVFHHPQSFNEVKAIVDDLKARKPVILNLEQVDHELARRIIDFISGAVYGINGNVQKVGSGVFLFTPSNIEIDGKELEDTLNKSILSNNRI